jgi:hypothetical protein
MWLEPPIIRELNGIGEGIDPELPPTTQYTQHPLITSEPNIQCRRGFPTHGLYSDQVVGGKKLLRISWGIPFPDQNYPPPQNEPPLFILFPVVRTGWRGRNDLPLMMEISCGGLWNIRSQLDSTPPDSLLNGDTTRIRMFQNLMDSE